MVLTMTLPIESHAASQPKLSHKNLTIYSGVGCGTKTITVKGLSEGTKVTWKSSNKKIATVKNGVVTPKKPGKVTITAQVQGKKLSCKVTVKQAKVYIMNSGNAKHKATVSKDGEWFEWIVGTDIPEGQYKVVPAWPVNDKYMPIQKFDRSTTPISAMLVYGEPKYDDRGLLIVEDRAEGNIGNKNFDLIEVKKGNIIRMDKWQTGNTRIMFIPIKYVNSFQKYSVEDNYENTPGESIYKVGRDIPEGRYVAFFERTESVNLKKKGERPADVIKIMKKEADERIKKFWTPDIVIGNSLYETRRPIIANSYYLGYGEKEYRKIKQAGKTKMISCLDYLLSAKQKQEGAYVFYEVVVDEDDNPSMYEDPSDYVEGAACLYIDICVPLKLRKGQWIYSDYVGSFIYPEPTKYTLNVESKTLKKGKSFQLKVNNVKPKGAFDKVVYSSSNKKIATVDEKGKVVAKKPGTAVITVQCPTNKKIKATCIITVESNKKPTKTPPPTKKPTATPTKKPTAVPTKKLTPTLQATKQPSVTPTQQPGETLTATPKVVPTAEPTSTQEPEAVPAQMESVTPTVNPEGEPTLEVTATITTEVEMTPEPGADIDVNAEDIEAEE